MLAAIINFLISLLIVPPKAPMLYLGIWNYYMFPENIKLSMDRYFPILLPGMPSLSLPCESGEPLSKLEYYFLCETFHDFTFL